jgi:hypothetical protein
MNIVDCRGKSLKVGDHVVVILCTSSTIISEVTILAPENTFPFFEAIIVAEIIEFRPTLSKKKNEYECQLKYTQKSIKTPQHLTIGYSKKLGWTDPIYKVPR